MLEVDNVRVRLGGADVLHGLSFCAAEGSTAALLGPSGCGKTTVLRVIAGLQEVEDGAVRLDGRDMAGVPPHQRGVGFMFQDYALFPHRTVAANVEFGLRMHGQPSQRRRTRVTEVLSLVGLAGFEARSVSALSGGERQRVALARSLAPEPRLLMLDEPLGSLDRTLRDRLVLELRELFAELGVTVVYVTHDQSEALALADVVTVLDRGRVVQSAPPEELWARPVSPFVARFLGLTNLVLVDVVGGEVRAPFGVLARDVERPDGPATALVRPDAVRLDPDAAVVGRVRSRAFAGDRTTVEVGLAGDVVIATTVSGSSTLEVGAETGIVVEPRGVQLFDRMEATRNGPPVRDTPE